MFSSATISDFLGGTPISATFDLFTDRSTKCRLQKARQRRQQSGLESVLAVQEGSHDNSLLTEIEVIYSFARIKQANSMGWRYWTQCRGSGYKHSAAYELALKEQASTQYWAVMKEEKEPRCRADRTRPVQRLELDTSYIPGSQKNRAVDDYVLRNQAELVPWGQRDYGFAELVPTSHRLETKQEG